MRFFVYSVILKIDSVTSAKAFKRLPDNSLL